MTAFYDSLLTSMHKMEVHLQVCEKLIESLGSVLISGICCLVSALVTCTSYLLLISVILIFELIDTWQDIRNTATVPETLTWLRSGKWVPQWFDTSYIVRTMAFLSSSLLGIRTSNRGLVSMMAATILSIQSALLCEYALLILTKLQEEVLCSVSQGGRNHTFSTCTGIPCCRQEYLLNKSEILSSMCQEG